MRLSGSSYSDHRVQLIADSGHQMHTMIAAAVGGSPRWGGRGPSGEWGGRQDVPGPSGRFGVASPPLEQGRTVEITRGPRLRGLCVHAPNEHNSTCRAVVLGRPGRQPNRNRRGCRRAHPHEAHVSLRHAAPSRLVPRQLPRLRMRGTVRPERRVLARRREPTADELLHLSQGQLQPSGIRRFQPLRQP